MSELTYEDLFKAEQKGFALGFTAWIKKLDLQFLKINEDIRLSPELEEFRIMLKKLKDTSQVLIQESLSSETVNLEKQVNALKMAKVHALALSRKLHPLNDEIIKELLLEID